MFEQLRKRSFKMSLLKAICMILISIVPIVWMGPKALYAVRGYDRFEDLAPEEIKNQLVDVELVENFGWYLEEYEEDTSTHETTTTYYYYIIYTGAYDDLATDYKFMAIKVPASYGNAMDEMSDNTYNGYLTSAISFSGEIRELDYEEYDYFVDFWRDMGYTDSEIEELTLPYCIDSFDSKIEQNILYVAITLAGFALLLFAFVRLIKGSRGSYLKKLQQDISSIGCSEIYAESDFNRATSFTKKDTVKLGQLFLYYNLKSETPRAVPLSKTLWAYPNTTVHRLNTIPTSTTYEVVCWVDGCKNDYSARVPNEAAAQEILNKIQRMCPWIVVGFSDELRNMYNNNRQEFLEISYNKYEHVAVEPGFEDFADQHFTPSYRSL